MCVRGYMGVVFKEARGNRFPEAGVTGDLSHLTWVLGI